MRVEAIIYSYKRGERTTRKSPPHVKGGTGHPQQLRLANDSLDGRGSQDTGTEENSEHEDVSCLLTYSLKLESESSLKVKQGTNVRVRPVRRDGGRPHDDSKSAGSQEVVGSMRTQSGKYRGIGQGNLQRTVNDDVAGSSTNTLIDCIGPFVSTYTGS